MPSRFPSHYVWRRQAPSLAGPWSAPVAIYSIPEYSPSNPGYGPHRFFYAAKEHIEFLNPANGIGIFTYAGNSFSAQDVEDDLDLYVPESVSLQLDPIPSGTYHGLLQNTNEPSASSSGSLTLTDSANGTFTGNLQLGATGCRLAGSFDSNSAANLVIARHGLNPLRISLQLDSAAGGDHLQGAVTWKTGRTDPHWPRQSRSQSRLRQAQPRLFNLDRRLQRQDF
jgi:hypothetical protein